MRFSDEENLQMTIAKKTRLYNLNYSYGQIIQFRIFKSEEKLIYNPCGVFNLIWLPSFWIISLVGFLKH